MNETRRESIRAGGRTRTFTAVGPDTARDLILIFHGSRQTGDIHRGFTGRAFDALADEKTAVAYLDGYRGNWNDARRESGFPARQENVDDVAFARAVIEAFGAGRTVASGYSNGGQLVMRLMHEAPELLTAAAIFGATMPVAESFLFSDAPAAPMPVLLSHGTKDPVVPYRGGRMPWWARTAFRVDGRSRSMPETARYFAERNGITTGPVSAMLPGGGRTSVERIAYRQEGRPPVTLYAIHGGGHTVPGPHDAPRLVGRTNHDISAADLVKGLL